MVENPELCDSCYLVKENCPLRKPLTELELRAKLLTSKFRAEVKECGGYNLRII